MRAKRAEVASVLAQIRELDSRLAKSVEAYNQASGQLASIRRELAINTYDLSVARRNLRRARQILAQRLVDLYTGEEGVSTLEIVLGARSLRDLIERIDAAARVAAEDARVLSQVRVFQARVARRQKELTSARRRQQELVHRLADERRSIESRLAERRQLVSSIRGEIARL